MASAQERMENAKARQAAANERLAQIDAALSQSSGNSIQAQRLQVDRKVMRMELNRASTLLADTMADQEVQPFREPTAEPQQQVTRFGDYVMSAGSANEEVK